MPTCTSVGFDVHEAPMVGTYTGRLTVTTNATFDASQSLPATVHVIPAAPPAAAAAAAGAAVADHQARQRLPVEAASAVAAVSVM